MSGGDGNSIASSCPSSRSSGKGQTTPAARARLRYPLTAPWLSPRLLAIASCGSLLAYRSRKTSLIWRIDRWIKRTVLVIGRAEVEQVEMGLGTKALLQCRDDATCQGPVRRKSALSDRLLPWRAPSA